MLPMYILRNLFLLLLLLAVTALQAQKIFKKGAILTTEGQRLDGFLMQKKLAPDADTIYFRNERSSKITESYDPTELLAYRFGKDRYYISAEVNKMEPFNLPGTTAQRLFLRQMNEGELALYTHQAKRKTHFYLQQNGGSLDLLSFEKIPLPDPNPTSAQFTTESGITLLRPAAGETVTDPQGNIYVSTDQLYKLERQYISDLRQAMRNCASMQISPRLPLEERAINELVEEYNLCVAPADYERLNRKPWLQISVIGYLGYNARQYDLYESLEYGLLLDIRENNWSPHVSLTLGIGRYTESERMTELFIEETEISTLTGRLNYHFLAGRNVRPYLFLGLRYFQFDTFFYRNGIGGITSRDSYRDFFSENGGLGLNWYFLNFNHLRLEIGYAGDLEASLGYGILLVK